MSRISISLVALTLMAGLAACDKQNPTTTTTSAAQPVTQTTTKATATTEAKPAASAAENAMAGKPIVDFKDVGLSTPESVMYDATDDSYIVSNINGQPLGVDGNGFLSRLSPDGKVKTLKWIESGKNKVTLNAPKGLAVVGDTLYVADIDTVRMFDRKTGAPTGEVKVPGATMLNDVAALKDGRIAVSDTGTEKAATDAVYTIDKAKKITTVAKSKDLGGPNGLLPEGDKLWVVTMRTGELYALDMKGKKSDEHKLPNGQLDGIVGLPGGDLLVTSWESGMVYRGKPGGDFKPAIEDVKSPADIGYDTKRSRVMVPLFQMNEVRVFDVK